MVLTKRGLRTVIVDAMPFDIDDKQAGKIVDVILRTIVKGVERDGFVTIEGLGRFFRQDRPARKVSHNVTMGANKIVPMGVILLPPKSYVNFVYCKSLRNALTDSEEKNA
jgi:nucleoid DNA-binding protein